MKLSILSKKDVIELIKNGVPYNVAIISFYSIDNGVDNDKIIYPKETYVFYANVRDIDIDILQDFGLTYDMYFSEVGALAEFIYKAYKNGMDIICQCEYGQSRSAACAAAIMEHFYGNGITIFRDYRYYPNQLVYNKLYKALEYIRNENIKCK